MTHGDSGVDGILATAIRAARVGGAVDHRHFGHTRPADAIRKDSEVGGAGRENESFNPVTAADREAESAITTFISQTYPGHGFLGEENMAGQERGGEHLWIIDPIDGTTNFTHGIPHYGVSVAYAHHGTVIAAACLDPERDELFTAVRGRGAWLNGRSLAEPGIHRATDVSEAIVCTGFYYDRGAMMERTLDTIRRLFRRGIHGIRRSGSAVLDICWTAAGRYDAFFEYSLQAWDFAAAALIAEEAGLAVTAADGSVATLATTSLACSSPALADDLIAIINQ